MNSYKNISRIISSLIFCALVFKSYSQEVRLDRADKKYADMAYIDASKIYLDIAESGYKSAELYKKLGNIYYFNAKYIHASAWYEKLFSLTEDLDPIYYLRYSQSLKALGNEELSMHWFDRYIKEDGLSTNYYDNALDYMQIIEENSGRYDMRPVNVNSSGVDFGVSFHGDKLVFASTQDISRAKGRLSPWDGLSYLDLFEARMINDGTMQDIVRLGDEINTKFHESSAAFTSDGKTMYFTRNNVTPTRKSRKQKVQHLKIYRAQFRNGKWTDVEDLLINGEGYSNAHPVLNPANDKMYFVSDRPGSYGLTDIYEVRIFKDGSLGNPKNLGEKVNTKGRESFPFLSKDNELYFSSDGHYGLGGYDVFYLKINEEGSFGNLLNVGKPINSSFDDVAFVIRDEHGFISSNRPGGQGYDDIYSFTETEKIKDVLKSRIFGIVTDKLTRKPLQNTQITLAGEDSEAVLQSLTTDDKGYYEAEVDIQTSYFIKADKDRYASEDAYSQKGRQDREHNFELTQNIIDVKEGDDIAKIFEVVIYFDLDKWNIRPDAQLELEKVVSVMKNYPAFNIDVRSHTDSRANDAYNMILSDNRAKSTINYLISRGIAKERLTGKGYGETKLVNHCDNGVRCREKEHQLNRRSEFIIEFNK